MNQKINQTRLQAALASRNIIDSGRSLEQALETAKQYIEADDAGQLHATVYGIVRHYESLEALLSPLLKKPFRNKDRDIHYLLLSAIYQLIAMRAPDHAVVNDSVNAATLLKKNWAKSVINGCLRAFLRTHAEPQKDWCTPAQEHPEWLRTKLCQQWEERAEKIMTENLHPAEMTLRVNRSKTNRSDYLALLNQQKLAATKHDFAPDAIVLKDAVSVEQLPGFSEGLVSVQDAAAQMASVLLDPQPGEHILDACAAPGGKTGHLLEITAGDLSLVAADINDQRLNQVRENLSRINEHCKLVAADLTANTAWWDGNLFDRILLDAPCSSTGVIRRHPDILRHRRSEDIAQLNQTQLAVLNRLWPLLKGGGALLYATCSVLSEENDAIIDAFIECHKDAKPLTLEHAWAQKTRHGCQTLPMQGLSDGFYTCWIEKS
ncbi:MAG: 16S rRNA (cytosine(967)-C(5))-methyltransferase RsmB [Proteobacteria bacterium]|nr:16S rRNA (cytosine(967)-C(5))-methyltransferase RsmB [Pseudomonadota bacterium]